MNSFRNYVESGRFERRCETLIDTCERPIVIFVAFLAGVVFGIAWMIVQAS
jgi:hypothetical protein